jgi:superoxide reductase
MSDAATITKCQEDLLCGVNMVKDLQNMTDMEKKHLPIISAPMSVKRGESFEVIVEIGKMMAHPNELTHYVEFIELYADHTYLARMDFTPNKTKPTMKVMVRLDHIHKSMRAFARCNLHGIWQGQSEIHVKE